MKKFLRRPEHGSFKLVKTNVSSLQLLGQQLSIFSEMLDKGYYTLGLRIRSPWTQWITEVQYYSLLKMGQIYIPHTLQKRMQKQKIM